MRMAGQVALITGGARGQGRAHAVRFAQEGCAVVLFDHPGPVATCDYPLSGRDELDETVALIEAADGQAIAIEGDVRSRADLDAAVEACVSRYGPPTAVLANAGIAPAGHRNFSAEQAWQDRIDIMLTGVYHTVEAAADVMIAAGGGGSIVITSSTAGLKGFTRSRAASSPSFLAYVAAKHGVVGLMREYANMLAPHSIRVNTVHPTGCNTPMLDPRSFADFTADHPEMRNALPVSLVEPTDIAEAMLYLCADSGRYVTGIALPVDAGLGVL